MLTYAFQGKYSLGSILHHFQFLSKCADGKQFLESQVAKKEAGFKPTTCWSQVMLATDHLSWLNVTLRLKLSSRKGHF